MAVGVGKLFIRHFDGRQRGAGPDLPVHAPKDFRRRLEEKRGRQIHPLARGYEKSPLATGVIDHNKRLRFSSDVFYRQKMPSIKPKISALGCYVPPGVLTNHDLEKLVQTNDEWILDRTGISERHIAAPDVATSDLATCAARA